MPQLQANNYSNIQQTSQATQARSCHRCGSTLTHFARFCGECGASGLNTGPLSVINFASVQSLSPMQALTPQTNYEPENKPQHSQSNPGFQYSHNSEPFAISTFESSSQINQTTPNFASVQSEVINVDPLLSSQLAKNMMLLARERILLYLHCLFFLAINIFGFWLSLKAYNEYNADDLTKSIIALTPLMFINSVGLVCLAPIKGTKREIARLKDKIKYIKVQIEYSNINF
jgi:ribosomal protein S27AE